jgi:hypothetical protein
MGDVTSKTFSTILPDLLTHKSTARTRLNQHHVQQGVHLVSRARSGCRRTSPLSPADPVLARLRPNGRPDFADRSRRCRQPTNPAPALREPAAQQRTEMTSWAVGVAYNDTTHGTTKSKMRGNGRLHGLFAGYIQSFRGPDVCD